MHVKRDQTVLKALAKRVRKFRLEAEISQEELAFLCEIDRTYISKIERGIANPSLLILVRIADILKIPLVKLFNS